MSLATYKASEATPKQTDYIFDLAEKRNYLGLVSNEVFAIIGTVKANKTADPTTPKMFVSKVGASMAIDALLGCKPKPMASVGTQDPMTRAKNLLLAKLPVSKYALPRKTDPDVWDFFEVVERKNGARYLNQLLGAPSDWKRKMLPVNLQLAAARAISADPKNAAIEYAKQHGRCAVCNAPLSNPKSIELSMGPVCAKKFS